MSKILVIEIDNEEIKIIEGSKPIKGKSMSIHKCLLLPIPIASMNDGKIINIDSIRFVIEKCFAENNIKTKKTIFIINTNSVTIRKIELPLLKRKSETVSMIKLELEQLQSSNSNQITFKIAEIINNECTKRAKYIVYSLSLNVYNQYIELSKMLKIKLIALDIASNFLKNIPQENIKINDGNYYNGINVFVNIDYKKIVFSVLNKGINDFSRAVYLNQNEEEMYQTDRVSEAFNSAYIAHINKENDFAKNQILDEISKNIRYYYSITKENIIDKIYICTSFTETDDLEEFLFSNLNIKIEVIKGISNLDDNYLDYKFNIAEYFSIVLALFIDKKDISFLTDKIRKQTLKFNVGVVVMAASLFFVLSIALYVQSCLNEKEVLINEIMTMNLYVNDEKNINFNKQIEGLKNNIAYLEKYNERAIKMKEIIRTEDVVSSQIFKSITIAKPLYTRIMFITIDKNNIQIQCTTLEVKDTMEFLENLRAVTFIDSIYIPNVDSKQEGEYSYSVICKLKDVVRDESK